MKSGSRAAYSGAKLLLAARMQRVQAVECIASGVSSCLELLQGPVVQLRRMRKGSGAGAEGEQVVGWTAAARTVRRMVTFG